MFVKNNPSGTVSWENLRDHFFEMQYVKMQELFNEDKDRIEKFHIRWNDFIIDFSKNRINDTTLQLLVDFAEEMQLSDGIKALFNGKLINETENRSVLHTALRDTQSKASVTEEIKETLFRIQTFSESVIKGEYKSTGGKAFTDIVNVGIGGSDLGPKMVVEALGNYRNHLKTHFVSNIDFDAIDELLKKLNPETTLIIVVSKSFTTKETIENALLFKAWLQTHGQEVSKHIIAVSTNKEEAQAFGIQQENIFPMWDFVGGRFSLWSAVGISIALSVGYAHFEALLKGAKSLDDHFKEESFDKNIPVVLALLSIWYNNFFGFETEAVIPYANKLAEFPAYLQQVTMESNGKNIDRAQNPVNYQTGTIVWGEIGTNSQHAFFQLFHQGTKIIPVDFIGFIKPFNESDMHDLLMANFFAQSEALLNGKVGDYAEQPQKDDVNAVYKGFLGNRPSNTFLIEKLTPESLGKLLAIYEHKTFVQGYLWNIYSFDQFGVEYGKKLAESIREEIQNKHIKAHDCSTTFLLENYLKYRKKTL